jgi:hypothetical protein
MPFIAAIVTAVSRLTLPPNQHRGYLTFHAGRHCTVDIARWPTVTPSTAVAATDPAIAVNIIQYG